MTDEAPAPTGRPVLWAVLAVTAVVAAGGLTWLALSPEPPATTDASKAILRYDKDGLRFTYHVPTGSEGLFDLAADPKTLNNLALQRPEVTAKMRRDLEREIGVDSLEDLKENFAEHIENLKGLGYL